MFAGLLHRDRDRARRRERDLPHRRSAHRAQVGHAELMAVARHAHESSSPNSWTTRRGRALAARFDVCYDANLVDRPDELRAALRDADALIVRNRTQVDAALLASRRGCASSAASASASTTSTSTACAARGIEVIPATGANALAVAEYVIATAMLLLRGAYRVDGRGRRRATGRAARCRTDASSPARRSASSASAASAALTGRLGRALGMRVDRLRPAGAGRGRGVARRRHGAAHVRRRRSPRPTSCRCTCR